MTPEEVNGLIAKRAAAFSRLDAAALGALYAENCVVDTPAGGGTVTGRDANENVYRGFFAAFPDLTIETQQVVSEGSDIAQLYTAVGTNAGGFMGLLARLDRADGEALRQAMACGTAMASMAIEAFSPARLLETEGAEIEARVRSLHALVHYDLFPMF